MGIYLEPGNAVHRDGVAPSLECPHCGKPINVQSAGVPDFDQLQFRRPKEIGMALQCDACNRPVFIRYRVAGYQPDRIDLLADEQLAEPSTETFAYNYLPDAVAENFRDALGCYSHELYNAFAVMCRRTALAAFAALGDRGKLRCYEHATDIQQLAHIDPADFEIARRVIFEMDLDTSAAIPLMTRMQAVVLLEVMKDMLHQAYVRGEKLRRALQLRRHFAMPAEAAMPAKPASQTDVDNTELDNASIIVRALKRADQS